MQKLFQILVVFVKPNLENWHANCFKKFSIRKFSVTMQQARWKNLRVFWMRNGKAWARWQGGVGDNRIWQQPQPRAPLRNQLKSAGIGLKSVETLVFAEWGGLYLFRT